MAGNSRNYEIIFIHNAAKGKSVYIFHLNEKAHFLHIQ